MTEFPIFVFVAVLILLYGLFSRWTEKTILTAPMVFVTVGLVVSYFNVDVLKEGLNASTVKVLAELTLMLVLFIDASTIDREKLKKERKLPLRLLGIGLPITMLLGSLIAIPLFPEIKILSLIMMAFILSPTDAALGQAVVVSKLVPLRIRQTINVESGLNDGIALPPILVCFAILSGESGEGVNVSYWLGFVLKQFLFGPLIGGLVGWLGGLLVERSSGRGWMSHTYQMLASLAIAILSFSLAEMVHGNGFIAAYFAGLMLGTSKAAIRERIREFGEAESQVMILFIFLLVGLILVPMTYTFWDWRSLLYAILSLTVIRMLPVALSLVGCGLNQKSVWFIGWFGPRGIASVLYMLMMVIELGSTGYEQIISVITLTVLISIFVHGISAMPLSKIFTEKERE